MVPRRSTMTVCRTSGAPRLLVPGIPMILCVSSRSSTRIWRASMSCRMRMPRALVAPHAGLMYSGPVAAYSYSAARAARPSAIVLVGPSHFVPFDGVSIWPAAHGTRRLVLSRWTRNWRGITETSDDLRDRRRRMDASTRSRCSCRFSRISCRACRLCRSSWDTRRGQPSFALSDAIARAVDDDPAESVLLIASSDLSHYEDANVAARLDGVVLEHVAAHRRGWTDGRTRTRAASRVRRRTDGGGAAMPRRDSAHQSARVLKYADSGDVSGDKSSVVGYMAAAIW